MKPRHVALAAAGAALLVGLVVLSEVVLPKRREAGEQHRRLLLPADARPDRFRIVHGADEMTFRRLFTADGIHNYFWKGRPVRG